MSSERKLAEKCLEFINKGVSSYHVVEEIKNNLKRTGFIEFKEKERWEIEEGGKYFVTRNDSSILAFQLPNQEIKGFHIVASHSDFPGFKLKENPEIAVEDRYVKLNAEPYGGVIYSTWMDRCLSVAGRVVYRDKGEFKTVNVCINEDLLVIPSVAVHMNREANKGVEFNPQVDMLSLLGGKESMGSLEKKIAAALKLEANQLLGKDLFLYVREKGRLAGADKEFMISPRLDDLQCVYGSLQGFLSVQPKEYASVYAVFDNEEVGSHTKQGAASTFLKDTLEKTGEALGKTGSEYLRLLADSFMISADNAHAVHPNHPEKSDQGNRPYLNGGIVIKYHGGQKYTTDAYSEAVMKWLCKEAGAVYQTYCNRSDMMGGSTLGNVSAGQVSIPAVDIGLPQLAMHSAVETAGSRDVAELEKVVRVFLGE